MSNDNGQHLDPVELASLPAGDPRREAYAGGLSGSARQAWEQEAALTDRLRGELPVVQVPVDLEGRLLALAGAAGAEAGRGETMPAGRAVGRWRPAWNVRVAAGLVILAGIAALYFLVLRQPSKPVRLDESLARTMAELAVQNHKAPLEIASADPNAVQKTLAAHSLDFPVIMLTPTDGTLQGGGVCDFGKTKAAFTQWQLKGQTYTLYEFNGKDLEVPALFTSLIELPVKLWQGDMHYQVFLFPGTAGKCCWALVMERDDSKNIFAPYGAAY